MILQLSLMYPRALASNSGSSRMLEQMLRTKMNAYNDNGECSLSPASEMTLQAVSMKAYSEMPALGVCVIPEPSPSNKSSLTLVSMRQFRRCHISFDSILSNNPRSVDRIFCSDGRAY